jgi:lysophospholipase L1-like esterase
MAVRRGIGRIGRDTPDRYDAAPMTMSVSDDPTTEPAPADAAAPADGPRSHRGSIIAGLVALVVLLIAVVAVAFALRPDGSAHQQRLAFIGDSITDQARPALTGAFPADDAIDIEAVPGRKFSEMLPFAVQAAQANPDEAVINLGSNDVLLGESDSVTFPAMDAMYDAFATTPCVTLVTVNQHFIFGSDQAGHAERINDRIRQAAAAHGWSVVDWNKIVEDDLAAGSPSGPLTTDSVHPSPTGQRVLVDAIHDRVEQCQAAHTSKTT